jgi:thiol-disulfide isomerase/thioredoxin
MAICHAFSCFSQPAKDPILLGIISADTLKTTPYKSWNDKNYSNYAIHPQVKAQFNKSIFKDISIEAFFGSWCGDSKREVPRFIKLLHEIGFNEQKFKLIGVGASDSLYKQSPGGEEIGKGIFKVPVFIIYKNGKEIGRINEYPANSLERDLLSILKDEYYSPNYKTFALVNSWLNSSHLKDSNVSLKGLATQLKPLAENEYELNSLAKLLVRQDRKDEALKLFIINSNLYPGSPTTAVSLAEVYMAANNKQAAIALLEKAIENNKSPEQSKSILELLFKAKKE